MLAPWKESFDKPRQRIKKKWHHFANKSLSSQSYGFSSIHIWMWELAHKEGWVPKSWCFWTVVLEKTLKSPLDCKEIKPVNPKGNQPWIFIGSTDAEAEAPVLWPPDAKSWLLVKDRAAEKGWRQKEKGETEDETVGWCHRLNGYEFEQTLGDDEGQPGVPQCMGSRRVGQDLVPEQQQCPVRTALRRCVGLDDVQGFYLLRPDTLATFTGKNPDSPKWRSYLEFHHGKKQSDSQSKV